jgi:hypothetical protein
MIWEGGALYYPLGLFPGHGDGPLEAIPWPTYNMTWINMVNRTHPITKSLPERMCILYYGGPTFHPYEGADVTILGRYNVNGQQPAIVATQYGLGRVFLSGPHPEIEEDDPRDGTWGDDYLDDHGSDWPLMYEAVKWLLWSPEVKAFSVQWDGETYNITTFSNSSLTEFNFNQSLKQISFSVNGPPVTGFCNITIPKRLLNCTSPEDWIVKLDDSQIPASALHIIDNATHTSIYFTYASGINNIKIIGTNVIPEFPTAIILSLFMIAVLIVVVLRRSFSRQKGK